MNYKKEQSCLYPEYSVDTEGIVYGKNGKPLKPSTNPKGYKMLNLMVDGKRIGVSVHKMVASQFLGVNELQINHKDGDKNNNCIDNLEWVTPSENVMHSIHILGNDNNKSKKRPIIMTTGNFDLQFDSIYQAELSLSKVLKRPIHRGAIHSALNRNGTVYGFLCRYV